MTCADPADLTVEEVREEVANEDDPEVLEEMLAAEEASKDRKTAKEAISEKLPDDSIDTQPANDDDDGDDDEVESANGAPSGPEQGEFVRVRPFSEGGHIAGYSFHANEVKEVKLDAKVQRAISSGELQYVR